MNRFKPGDVIERVEYGEPGYMALRSQHVVKEVGFDDNYDVYLALEGDAAAGFGPHPCWHPDCFKLIVRPVRTTAFTGRIRLFKKSTALVRKR